MILRDDQHIYRNEKGKIYLSCTQHLTIAGLVDFSMVKETDLEHARTRGTFVHDAVRMYLNNDLNTDNPMEGYRGYVEAFIKFSKEHNLTVWDSEGFIKSDKLMTAGEFDLVGMINSDVSSPAYLFEIKTPTTMPLTAPLQVAAYVKLWNECKKNKIFGGYGLHLKKNGTYRLYKYDLIKYGKWFESIVRCNWNALSEGIIPTPAKANPQILNLCKTIIGGQDER